MVYLRNGTGNPLVTYAELGSRWGLSKATVGRLLKKLEDMEYLSLISFPGRQGSVIYLKSYLSTMFQISDVMIDKEEVAMVLNIKIKLPEESANGAEDAVREHEVCVSKELSSVSKSHIEAIVQNMAKILSAQGVLCFGCPKSKYKLFPLSSGCREVILDPAGKAPPMRRMGLSVLCGDGRTVYTFELTLTPSVNVSERRTF